jgi:hypothetical protein
MNVTGFQQACSAAVASSNGVGLTFLNPFLAREVPKCKQTNDVTIELVSGAGDVRWSTTFKLSTVVKKMISTDN